MLDIKGADASKVILVIGIMTLHSFGEGSGVGVSFAGSKGFSQGLLVTLAIAVHNIPEGLAVSMLLASKGVSPPNAMLWSVITSLPQVIYYAFYSIVLLTITHLVKEKCILNQLGDMLLFT
jgi:zinc transporter ZupT